MTDPTRDALREAVERLCRNWVTSVPVDVLRHALTSAPHRHVIEYPSTCTGCEHLAAAFVAGAPEWMRVATPALNVEDRIEVDRVARVLMAEWERVEGPIVGTSWHATFADLARAAIRAQGGLDVETLARAFHVIDHPAIPQCELGESSTDPGVKFCVWKMERLATEYARLREPAPLKEAIR